MRILEEYVESSRRILGENLVGIYLHGSAVMNCFNPLESDLDLLVVVEKEIPAETKLDYMNMVVRLNEQAPAKGIEMSIVKREYCRPFVYPTPFELHFSRLHLNWFLEKPQEYVEKMNGKDRDLAAHFTIIYHRGKTLYGAAISEVFAEVSRKDYIDSIRRDIADAKEEILSNTMYITLNLCRVLGFLRDSLILSKKEGGEWGLQNVSERYHGLIRDALSAYQADGRIDADRELAQNFADYMMKEIRKIN